MRGLPFWCATTMLACSLLDCRTVEASELEIPENGGGFYGFVVSGGEEDCTATWSTTNGTVTPGEDLEWAGSGSVTAAPHESKERKWAIYDDNIWEEGGEDFTFTVSFDCVLDNAPPFHVLIKDGNDRPKLSVAPMSVSEPITRPIGVKVSASNPASKGYTVKLQTIAGSAQPEPCDFRSSGKSVTIPAGSQTVTVPLNSLLINDEWPEPNERFGIKVSYKHGSGASDITIADDDGPFTADRIVELLLEGVNRGSPQCKEQVFLARSQAHTLREQCGMSTNTTYRDAEYRLIGIYGGTLHSLVYTLGTVGAPVYVGVKAVLDFFGTSVVLRSNPDNPNSPPGAYFVSWWGFRDGLGFCSSPSKSPVKPVLVWHRTNSQSGSQAPTNEGPYSGLKVEMAKRPPANFDPQLIVDQIYDRPLVLTGHEELVTGGPGPNVIRAGAGKATIFGNGGPDTLKGGKFADLLDGGDDDDNLDGQGGRDVVIGGRGADRISLGDDLVRDVVVYLSADELGGTPSRTDIVQLFLPSANIEDEASDRIDLSQIDADAEQSGDQPFRFVTSFVSADVSEPKGQVRLQTLSFGTQVQIDTDGDNSLDRVIQVPEVKLTRQDLEL